MRVTTEVTDLNPAQIAYVTQKVPLGGREFLPGLPRVCAGFNLGPGIDLHVEMDTVELAGLLVTLASIGLRATAEAELVETTGENLPCLPSANQVRDLSAAEAAELARVMNLPPCSHGAHAVTSKESVFRNARPTVTYADGCQSYGPYQNGQGHGAGWND